jgi:indole-3-glycerol phosphate synthase
MSDTLAKICVEKKEHILQQKRGRSEADLIEAACAASPVRGFANALKTKYDAGVTGLIAEIKKASPSKGIIREDFDPPTLALAYQDGGATCLSVLTDEPYFQGKDDYLSMAREVTDLPALRKDFILDPYQVIESRAIGADCILLIMAALSDAQAEELEAAALEFHMDVLVEVHDEDELERAMELDSILLGINNRNLKTLEVDLANTERLAIRVPAEKLIICESGVYTHDDIKRMNDINVNTFLVGESLMREKDVAAATKALLAT